MTELSHVPAAWFFMCLQLIVKLAATADTYDILEAPNITKRPDCPSKCGNLTVPYPFGVGKDCSIEPRFDIVCDTSSSNAPKAFILGNIEVYHISDNHLRVSTTVSKQCFNSSSGKRNTFGFETTLGNSSYSYSDANSFFLISCNNVGYVGMDKNWTRYTGCVSYCSGPNDVTPGSCTGFGCCQVPIPKLIRNYTISFNSPIEDNTVPSFNCSYGFLGERDRFQFRGTDDLQDPLFENRTIDNVPLVLDWAITLFNSCKDAEASTHYACKANSDCVNSTTSLGGYRCQCKQGYKGNPYLDSGCQDIDECEDPRLHNCTRCTNLPGSFSCSCPPRYSGDGTKGSCTRKFPVMIFSLGMGFGILTLFIVVSLYFGNKRRRLTQLREKFFLQNGGLLLKEQINSSRGGVQSTRLFTAEELEKATNNYAKDMILGQGGYGIVYKGILLDKSEVAIKKPKIMDKSQIEQFINEVVILTQVNHRNVVKLLGCCLEAAEVPFLVYEYVSNGTLFDHIHNTATSWLSWANRLRIAIEASDALAYLHSAASKPVIHRDVKSANILLDHNYTAKISDFGASRLISLDQTQVATMVQGTLGYLDPEYLLNSQLTEKSDVYSFGVVLAELLTGKKALCTEEKIQEVRNLTVLLVMSMEENQLLQILDPRIVREGAFEQIEAVAQLMKKCVNVTGEGRPTMKEVTMELESIRKSKQQPWKQSQGEEEVMGPMVEEHELDVYGNRDIYTVQSSSYPNSSNFSGQYSLEIKSISQP